MGRKPKAAQILGAELTNTQGESVLLWKVNTPLSTEEHETLVAKLRQEQEHSGVKIILVPYSVDAEIDQDEPEQTVDEDPPIEPPANGGEDNDK